MPQKRYIGKFLSFRFKGYKKTLSGIVLNYNDDYTLIRASGDYRLDGYTIFKNQDVEYLQDDYEKRAARIFKLKNYQPEKEPAIPIDDLDNIFTYLNQHYQLMMIDLPKGDAGDVVSYTGKVGKMYHFQGLTVDGKWKYTFKFQEKSCRYIHFDNDYLNGLKLITKFKKAKGK